MDKVYSLSVSKLFQVQQIQFNYASFNSLTMYNLQEPDTKELLKGIKERMLVGEARSGEDFDLVTTLNFDNTFKVVCDFEEHQKQKH